MLLDGSVKCENGYDPITQLIIKLPEGVNGDIPMFPSMDQVMAAVELVNESFKQFPFETVTDRSVFFSLLLTSVMRPVLPTAPGFLIEAAMPGTGKTLLADCILIILSGMYDSVPEKYHQDKSEFHKTLMSTLATGQPYIFFDNVDGEFGNDTMDIFLTSSKISGRLLGGNKRLNADTNLLVIATGNNATLSGDAFRRVMVCRLNAKVESPHLLTFEISDLKKHVFEHRLDIIKAILTIKRGYLTLGAGTFEAKSPLGSFGDWDSHARQVVCWLAQLPGCPIELGDPAESLINNRKKDASQENMRQVFSGWRTVYGNNFKTAKDVIGDLFNVTSTLNEGQEILKDALLGALNCKFDSPKTRDLTTLLKKNHQKIFDNLELQKSDTQLNGYDKWRVVSLSGENVSGNQSNTNFPPPPEAIPVDSWLDQTITPNTEATSNVENPFENASNINILI